VFVRLSAKNGAGAGGPLCAHRHVSSDHCVERVVRLFESGTEAREPELRLDEAVKESAVSQPPARVVVSRHQVLRGRAPRAINQRHHPAEKACSRNGRLGSPVGPRAASEAVVGKHRIRKYVRRAHAPVKVRLDDPRLDPVQRLVPLPQHEPVPEPEERLVVSGVDNMGVRERLVKVQPLAVQHDCAVCRSQELVGGEVVVPLPLTHLLDILARYHTKAVADAAHARGSAR
jgi:hypothetical protein